jgi:hypothetical protein
MESRSALCDDHAFGGQGAAMKRDGLTDMQISRLCLGAALILLTGAAWSAGGWLIWAGLTFDLLALTGWILWRRRMRAAWSWLPGAFLAFYITLAAAGLILRANFHLAAVGLCAALAAFELADAADAAGQNPDLEEGYRRRRLGLLGAVTAGGLVLMEAARLLNFSIPFGILGLAALLVLYGLVKFYGVVKET